MKELNIICKKHKIPLTEEYDFMGNCDFVCVKCIDENYLGFLNEKTKN